MTRTRLSAATLLTASVLALLAAAWLRLYRLDNQSLWNDEGNSLGLARRGVGDIVRAAAADIHPPGYYLALSAWHRLTGDSEFALRAFSALAGLVLVALVYRLARRYFDGPAAVGAAVAAALNPFLIYYSQEARMYSLLAVFSAASFLLFTLWLRSSRPPAPPGGHLPLGVGYSLVTAAGLYTHYAFGFVVIAQNVAALGSLLAHGGGTYGAPHTRLRRLGAWLGWQALAGVLYLPWAPIAWRQLTTWPAERSAAPLAAAAADLSRYLLFGRTLPTALAGAGLAGAAVLLLFGLQRRGQTITPFLWALVPAGLTLGLGLLTEPFAKFLLVAVPAVCVLLGQGMAGLQDLPPQRRFTAPPPSLKGGGSHEHDLASRSPGRQEHSSNAPISTHTPPSPPLQGGEGGWGDEGGQLGLFASRLLHAALFIAWLAGLGGWAGATYQSLNNLYFDPAYFRDDYRGIALQLAAQYRPGDAVITIAPNQVEAYGYYHTAPSPIYPLPNTRPPDPGETQAALEAIAAQHPRIFVLFWGEQQADPAGLVENWLNTHAFKASDAWFGQVRLATYAAAPPASAPIVPVGARFGEHITLHGYRLAEAQAAPGDIVPISLVWQTDTALQERYKVFVHIYADENASPVAQQDGEPGGGLAPTHTWAPGQPVADNHGVPLPPDLPAGDYTLYVGLYDLFTGVRLPIEVEGAPGGDRLPLATIAVR